MRATPAVDEIPRDGGNFRVCRAHLQEDDDVLFGPPDMDIYMEMQLSERERLEHLRQHQQLRAVIGEDEWEDAPEHVKEEYEHLANGDPIWLPLAVHTVHRN